MKKPVKIVLWGFGIIVIIMIIVTAVFYINFRQATKAMTPSETTAVNDSVWCIKDRFVNAYIFKGNQSYLMVDAGISEKNFKNEMGKLGISPEKVTTLLLTHTDGDHIGATALFKNAVIYMQKDEKQMIDGTTGKTKMSKTIWKFGPYNMLAGNDTPLIDGLKIRLLHTPGHTPGSSCFIIGDDYLITGDNMVLSNGKYEHFVERFNMNTAQQIESLKILPDPETFRFILTSHHGVIKN
jgi:glyoxylase-like metal-dependent hydrolase (beta-lactamase superfamily II)